MKLSINRITLWLIAAAFFLSGSVEGQRKPAPKRPVPPKPVIFAVVNDGKWIEPIARVDGEKLISSSGESDDAKTFSNSYYKPKSIYALIFGGAQEGLATVVKSNIGSECGGGSADVTVKAPKAKLVSPVFALATNVQLKSGTTGFRRRPTPAERAEIEKLVRAQFSKNKASAAATKTLRYHNLTAVDTNGDGKAEFVGSYWIAPTANERRLLFFITGHGPNDEILFEFSEHSVVTPEDVMTSDLKDVDEGRGAELLIDLLDFDGDGTKEIFTIGQAFEGNNYYVYQRSADTWKKIHETYVYRCAF